MQAFHAKAPPLAIGSDEVIRVARTRVPLETVVGAFDAGATAEEIAQQYPSLGLGDVYSVISYVLENRAFVDAYVRRRREVAVGIQERIEANVSPLGLRARLLARRAP